MDKQPTEARQDELADIQEKIAQQLHENHKKTCRRMLDWNMVDISWKDLDGDARLCYRSVAGTILSLTVSSGGGVCPECKGEKTIGRGTHLPDCSYHTIREDCPTCNGTGQEQPKTLGEIIKEYQDE